MLYEVITATGRGSRIGQRCIIDSSRSPPGVATTAIVSSTRYSPAGAIDTSLPDTPGGTQTRCSILEVSCTTPSTAPAETSSPAATRGSKAQAFVP